MSKRDEGYKRVRGFGYYRECGKETMMICLTSDLTDSIEVGDEGVLCKDGTESWLRITEKKRYANFEELLVVEGVNEVMPGMPFDWALDVLRDSYDSDGHEGVYLIRMVRRE